MKYIVINFRGGGKIKLPANILKSIDVPDDFTVNKEGENTNKRICIGSGCYVDSLDETKSLEQQLPDKKCYASDDFNNNQLVDDGDYEFLEEILNTYTHIEGLVSFSTTNGTIDNGFGYEEEVINYIPIGCSANDETIIVYVYYDTEKLAVGTNVYADEEGNAPAPDGEYALYEDTSIEVSNDIYAFYVENGQVSELYASEDEE